MWPDNPVLAEIRDAMSATASYSYSDHTDYTGNDFSAYSTIKKLSEGENETKTEVEKKTPEEYGNSLMLSDALLKIINEAGNDQGWPEFEKFVIPDKVNEALEIALYSMLEIKDKKDDIRKYYKVARKDLLGEDVE